MTQHPPHTTPPAAMAAGLDPEQEIRGQAIAAAARIAASGDRHAAAFWDNAAAIAAWIRDGSRP